jgi:hypothetical protein
MVSCMGTTRFSCTSLAASSGLPAHMNWCDKGPLQTSQKQKHTCNTATPHGVHPICVGYAHFTSILTSLWGAGEPLMREGLNRNTRIANGAEAYPQERHQWLPCRHCSPAHQALPSPGGRGRSIPYRLDASYADRRWCCNRPIMHERRWWFPLLGEGSPPVKSLQGRPH